MDTDIAEGVNHAPGIPPEHKPLAEDGRGMRSLRHLVLVCYRMPATAQGARCGAIETGAVLMACDRTPIGGLDESGARYGAPAVLQCRP
jgi:hypothetical protein